MAVIIPTLTAGASLVFAAYNTRKAYQEWASAESTDQKKNIEFAAKVTLFFCCSLALLNGVQMVSVGMQSKQVAMIIGGAFLSFTSTMTGVTATFTEFKDL